MSARAETVEFKINPPSLPTEILSPTWRLWSPDAAPRKRQVMPSSARLGPGLGGKVSRGGEELSPRTLCLCRLGPGGQAPAGTEGLRWASVETERTGESPTQKTLQGPRHSGRLWAAIQTNTCLVLGSSKCPGSLRRG